MASSAVANTAQYAAPRVSHEAREMAAQLASHALCKAGGRQSKCAGDAAFRVKIKTLRKKQMSQNCGKMSLLKFPSFAFRVFCDGSLFVFTRILCAKCGGRAICTLELQAERTNAQLWRQTCRRRAAHVNCAVITARARCAARRGTVLTVLRRGNGVPAGVQMAHRAHLVCSLSGREAVITGHKRTADTTTRTKYGTSRRRC